MTAGLILPAALVEVVPTAHYFMGGVVCEVDTSTEMAGLFVAGEDASGMHGANRLGGNGVANSTVFGEIAGDVMPGWIAANPGYRSPDEGVLAARRSPARLIPSPETRRPERLRDRLLDSCGTMSVSSGTRGDRSGLVELDEIEAELLGTGVSSTTSPST